MWVDGSAESVLGSGPLLPVYNQFPECRGPLCGQWLAEPWTDTWILVLVLVLSIRPAPQRPVSGSDVIPAQSLRQEPGSCSQVPPPHICYISVIVPQICP